MTLRMLFSLCIILAVASAASAQTPIHFDPDDGEVDTCTDTLYCTEIWIGPVPDIKGYTIEITFRSDELNLHSIMEGDIFSSAGHETGFLFEVRPGMLEDIDTVAVDGADLTRSVSGPGHLFTMCFGRPWVNTYQSPLVFINADVRDSLNQDVDVVTEDGSLTILEATSLDVTNWGGIKSLFR
ncbi:MAG: hypothetical protein ABIJ00_12630 [Candidatus Eisenbacteria bacterium]